MVLQINESLITEFLWLLLFTATLSETTVVCHVFWQRLDPCHSHWHQHDVTYYFAPHIYVMYVHVSFPSVVKNERENNHSPSWRILKV